ncbi:hypothetical protein Tco_0627225 [Tanacetum coccineum]|uniref:Retrovirus-related Pol polyprotein from transposon TNT 1-94-like beta-barrel domain-containing protein n=1 Tax=Tanacetum coccineum TaxID=301880 RepID=A0ABQ4WLX0_9ASTR
MDLETTQTTTTAKLPILKQGPVTIKEKVQKKNDVKARSMLLMALPNEHLMTFNQYKDAKTLCAAHTTRFGVNERTTKNTRKTLLKQMYKNFSAPSTESLDSIFNRLQKIISQLAILGENISHEDLNLNFLRSLPSDTHVMVWRNKLDLDTMSFNNLYNNFKIVEQEVKGTASSSSSSSSPNMDFVSSPGSTNEVNTAYGDTLQGNAKDLGTKIAEIGIKTTLERLKCGKKLFQSHGGGVSKMELHEFEGYGPKTSKSVSEDTSNEIRESLDASLVEELVSNDKLKSVNTTRPNSAIVNAVKTNQVNAVKASACWVWRPTKLNMHGNPQQEDQGYVDSGCSRHMTGNMSYLSNFKEFDGGYVTFGGGDKGERITGKGTLKTGKLDFEDVYFIKELQFNLFSISQMCDKKNNVLFIDTRCFVLSPDFKLADES